MITSILFLAVVSFLQNMAFTYTSRSRNSGDPSHHFKAAIGSNGIWFVCNYFILFPELLKITVNGDTTIKLTIMLVYIISTALGSVFMMKLNLGHYENTPLLKYLSLLFKETGKRKVGNR